MLRAINISPLDTSRTLEFACEGCGKRGTIYLENSIVNVDAEGNIVESVDGYDCPDCGKPLATEGSSK